MLKAPALALIRLYQLTLSRLLGPTCRFEPSCSEYTAISIERFGVFRGAWLGLKRILRCHPFSRGGFDPPPSRASDNPIEKAYRTEDGRG